MNNTTFPFYTSTAHQDANRVNTPSVRICPRNRLLPFQVQRSHNTSAINSIKLVDCSGGETSLGTSYFSSIGTSIADDSALGVKQFTSVDYMQYAGGPLETKLPYGVYYIELGDSYGKYYSEHFSVRDIVPDVYDTWANAAASGYGTFVSSGNSIATAISLGADSYANLGAASIKIGEKIIFEYELTVNSGQVPFVRMSTNGGVPEYSDTQQLTAGFGTIELTSTHTIGTAYFTVLSTAAASFAVPWARGVRDYGDYIKLEFSNTDDLIHSGTDSIMYATGGFKQRAYLNTRLNIPAHEPIEVGEEIDGVFIPEQLNSTYLYSVVDYVSRSMYNGMQYMFMHDSIEITDEVGNEYSPNVGNGRVAMDWGTFDTGSLRVEFNDGSMNWVNDQAAIT